ncbi:MAG: DUF58 domain-containing protein [Planctomycetaceae bacterium]|nr:DUF58 domain-containing protein [Planctomycetaceae bacterium]
MDPQVVMAIKSLELRAKIVMDGFRTGQNRSPRHGFSVEFSEYRQYTQGDDPRFLDWKLFARTDRSYIRLFEDETNLRCYVVMDASRSMDFGTPGYTKFDYGRTIAASIAWMLNRQGDAVGLTLFDEAVRLLVPARYRPGQLRRLLVALEEPTSGKETNPELALETAARRLNKQGLVVLVSDLLADISQIEEGLKLLRGCRHDLIVFQVLDPAELTLDIPNPHLFEDLETGQQVFADPALVRSEFVDKIQEHNRQVRLACESVGASFVQLTTDQPLELALAEFLQARRQR